MMQATIQTANDRGGNGKFKPLKRSKKAVAAAEDNKEFTYLDSFDSRMRFNNSKDPIYFAFEYLEKRSVAQLAGDFVKDSFYEITNFVSKVVR